MGEIPWRRKTKSNQATFSFAESKRLLADVGFSPEAEDVEGVVQECDTDLSPDVDSKDKRDNKAENHNLNTGNWNQHQTSRIHACARHLTQVISLPRYHRVDSGNSWLTRYEVDVTL